MSSNNNEPPAHLEDVPFPDDEWSSSPSGPPEDAPPPEDGWMPPEPEDLGPPPGDLPPPSSAPSRASNTSPRNAPKPSGSPAGDGSDRAFGRGVTVKIIGGREGVGVVGEIFWWGESKFGEGMRAGVNGPGDASYWVDEEHLGWPDDDVPEEVLEAVAAQPDMGKGDRVRVLSGNDKGTEGVIFWWGDSKWGDGMRAGIETDDGETVWSDASELEKVDSPGGTPEADDDIPF